MKRDESVCLNLNFKPRCVQWLEVDRQASSVFINWCLSYGSPGFIIVCQRLQQVHITSAC